MCVCVFSCTRFRVPYNNAVGSQFMTRHSQAVVANGNLWRNGIVTFETTTRIFLTKFIDEVVPDSRISQLHIQYLMNWSNWKSYHL